MKRFLGFLAVLVILVGCNTSQTYQVAHESKNILWSKPIREAISYQGINRNPVIIVHGLLGGKLENINTSENVWGEISIQKIRENFYTPNLSFPMELGVPLSKIQNNAKIAGILDITSLTWRGNVSFYLEGYDVVVKELNKLGYNLANSTAVTEENQPTSLYTFSYDWRRDISQNVVELDKFIKEKELEQKAYYKSVGVENPEIKFDIVAHSMGGLLTRYYLQYGGNLMPLDGSMPKPVNGNNSLVEKAVIVGTPNAGYLDTFIELLNGTELYPNVLTLPKEIVGTFASYYFMLPPLEAAPVVYSDNGEVVDIFDVELWEKYNWGLADQSKHTADMIARMLSCDMSSELQRTIAIEHISKNLTRAKQFQLAMQKDLAENKNVKLYLFSGDGFNTNVQLKIDRKTGKIVKITQEAGDGKVSSSSARYDRRAQNSNKLFLDSPIPWDAIYYCESSHMGIFKSNTFISNIGGILFSDTTDRQKKLEK